MRDASPKPAPERVWYRPENRGQHREYNIDLLHMHWEKSRSTEDFRRLNVPGQTWIGVYVLPPFQRAFKWTEAQQVRFIESAARGLPIGTYTYNDGMDLPPTIIDGTAYTNRTDRWLIDGQQRITSLIQFFEDAFPVFGYRWSEIPPIEQRKFLMQPFTAYELREGDEAELRRIYNLMNFSGTPHTEDERA
jgi:Protein of unknown function DUF262